MKLSQKRSRHNSHRMWPKSTLNAHNTQMQGEAHHTKSLIFPGPQPEASATDVSGPRKEDLKAHSNNVIRPSEQTGANRSRRSKTAPSQPSAPGECPLSGARGFLLQLCPARGCSRSATTHRRPFGAEHKPLRCPRRDKTQTSQFMNSQTPSARQEHIVGRSFEAKTIMRGVTT